MITLIDDALLDAVCAEAAASPRRRKNRNFHPGDDFPAHRLLNAMQPDSYVPPHRHLDAAKDETFVALRGILALVIFDDTGAVTQVVRIGRNGGALGADIPHGTWHTVVALEPDSVFLEAKAGPYRPLSEAERAPWAPAEGAPEAPAYFEALQQRITGND